MDLINRDISWLSFNERVLQEAEDATVPLIERLRFLGIYSNNRDEFFRVRVAALRRLASLRKKDQKLLKNSPQLILNKIQSTILKQEKRVQKAYKTLLHELDKNNISLVDNLNLPESIHDEIRTVFRKKIRPALVPIMLDKNREFPFLKDRASYLAIKFNGLKHNQELKYALLEIPTKVISRFITLTKKNDKQFVVLQDDVIRFCLAEIFNIFEYESIEAYSIKVTRDAELDLDDDISKSLIDKLSKSLKNRSAGAPVRFIYDKEIAPDLLEFLTEQLELKKNNNIIASGRYHNFRDFISFPDLGNKHLTNKQIKNVPHRYLHGVKSTLNTIKKQDIFLHYPYHSFNYIVDILREAAIDPEVTSIKINLYRVAKNSHVINALINAVKNGKKVLAVVELKARFDEEANIEWANKLQEEGASVVFGSPELKIHAKLIVITKIDKKGVTKFAHIGTGNFNEKTANIYTDISIITSNKKISNEADKVFDFIENPYSIKRFSSIILSPFATRRKFISLIDTEIENAQKGKNSYIILKLNNLVDSEMIDKLYEANQFGVTIKLIIRGICALTPGVKDLSDRIEVISIVDRFLEHSRVAIFCNDDNEKQFISSADWMARNLDNRIEVSVPILDNKVKKLLRTIIDLQLSDNTKARIIDKKQKNTYKRPKKKNKQLRSQIAVHEYLMNNFSQDNNVKQKTL